MQSDQSDQELNFKKRARRRLVGAIALVLLMIILLPMVLKERTAGSPQEQITITLPDGAAPTTSTSTDFDSNVVPHESAKSMEAVQPEAALAESADEQVNAKVEVKPEPTPTQAKPEVLPAFLLSWPQ